ncbi:hypothetical protein BUALT_Bualt15G0059800 [Buddleja alternifolia]|uniref:Proline iminopeptidase n=1 Tax=Buddleja alternifolia TaxID=168488 RepID=A0AAV6WNK1_9LAMI|nr:hypothetical protein BUALT_Bualt15G0059800 [Buddleja alternifolia]
MANHDVTEVIGMGNINLETDTGCRLILRDVRHIPDIWLNIISTGKLDDDGYVSNFGEGKWKLTKGSRITAKAQIDDVQGEPNDTIDDELVDDQVPPIQTDDPVPPQETTVRRSTRQTRPSTRYNPDEYVMLTDGGEPESYPEAISHDQRDMWMEAMKEEMKSLQENHTYDLVKLPKGKRTLKNNSLPDSWDTLVVSVSNSAPNGDLTLQVVKDCLLNEESRRKEQAFSTEQNALMTENSDRRGRNKSRGPQHQRDKSRGKSKFKGDFKCHYCGGPNHYERDCRKKKRDQKNENNENKKDDKDTTAVATDGDVVIICDDACVSSSCQETDWIIDSGVSYHITPHRDMFTSYTSGNFGRVRMANHGVTEVIGMGNINLETDTGCRLILRDVRHIPDIRLNIISTSKLDDDGYVSNFGEGKWKLTKGSLITAKGKKKNSLYLMQAKLSNGEVNAAVNNSSIELWHKRLGHLSQKGMQLLAKKKLLPDSERKESTQEVPDDLDPVPSHTTRDHGGDVQGEPNDTIDDEPVDDQVPPIQTDDPVLPQEATPVVFLHGGPGGGTSPSNRKFFDPNFYRIILFDQRGAGKSTPHACLEENTTWDLIKDIEKLRELLKVPEWLVFGGSWGSTLALAYSESHPDKVTGLVLRGIFLLRKKEIDWFYEGGAAAIFPDAWEPFRDLVPESERGCLIDAYRKRLNSTDKETQYAAAREWTKWEMMTAHLLPNEVTVKRGDDDEFCLAFARIENHYFVNKGFFPSDSFLLDNIEKIKHIKTVIVQGRYDVCCPMMSAWDLHKAWPEADFRVVADAGHSANEPGISRELVAATEKMKHIITGSTHGNDSVKQGR